jgi:3-methyladenine DNA glycosylase Tag
MVIEKEYEYFVAKKNDLLKKYNNKYIIIQNQKVVSSFDNIAMALEYIQENSLIFGDFLLDLVNEETYKPKAYNSLVSFK